MQKVKDNDGIRTQTIRVKGESATECATRASNHRLITFIVYLLLRHLVFKAQFCEQKVQGDVKKEIFGRIFQIF